MYPNGSKRYGALEIQSTNTPSQAVVQTQKRAYRSTRAWRRGYALAFCITTDGVS